MANAVMYGSFAVTMSASEAGMQEAHKKAQQGDLELLSRRCRGSGNVAVAAGAVVTNPHTMKEGSASAATALCRTILEAAADCALLHYNERASRPEVR